MSSQHRSGSGPMPWFCALSVPTPRTAQSYLFQTFSLTQGCHHQHLLYHTRPGYMPSPCCLEDWHIQRPWRHKNTNNDDNTSFPTVLTSGQRYQGGDSRKLAGYLCGTCGEMATARHLGRTQRRHLLVQVESKPLGWTFPGDLQGLWGPSPSPCLEPLFSLCSSSSPLSLSLSYVLLSSLPLPPLHVNLWLLQVLLHRGWYLELSHLPANRNRAPVLLSLCSWCTWSCARPTMIVPYWVLE